jgi:ABC-type molybdenum transport system ATPase subunit/photorepair protein PhrA
MREDTPEVKNIEIQLRKDDHILLSGPNGI